MENITRSVTDSSRVAARRIELERSQLLYSVEQAAALLKMSRTGLFNAINRGRVATIKLGKLTRLSRDELERIAREGLER